MDHKHHCKEKMSQAIKDLNEAKKFLMLKDYEEAENKLSDALDCIAKALDCLEHRGEC